MATHQAFVDESIRRGRYLLCASLVLPAEVPQLRSQLKGLCAPGQRRIHFVDESDSRRRSFLAEVSSTGVRSLVLHADSLSQAAARSALLEEMMHRLATLSVRRLVLDSRAGQDRRDRATISRFVHLMESDFVYTHQRSSSEPLLWIPDAVAWAWGRGGAWRRRVSELGLVAESVTVDVQ